MLTLYFATMNLVEVIQIISDFSVETIMLSVNEDHVIYFYLNASFFPFYDRTQ